MFKWFKSLFGSSLAFVIFTPLALLGLWGILIYSRHPSLQALDTQVKVFDIILKITTISALTIGGAWSYQGFLRQRLKAPRLNVTQANPELALTGRSLAH